MKLPRFPIRKSLIPYEDLGIQDVSPDNQILGDDISIIIAAIEAMGKHGTRMLQVDDNGNLIVNAANNSIYKYGGEHKVLLNKHVTNTDVTSENFDLSHGSKFVLLITTTNYNDVGVDVTIHVNYVDDIGNLYKVDDIATVNDNYTTWVLYSSTDKNMVFVDNFVLTFEGVAVGKSIDFHIDSYGV